MAAHCESVTELMVASAVVNGALFIVALKKDLVGATAIELCVAAVNSNAVVVINAATVRRE